MPQTMPTTSEARRTPGTSKPQAHTTSHHGAAAEITSSLDLVIGDVRQELLKILLLMRNKSAIK